MYQHHQLFDWQSFTKALELRFGPSTYVNHQAELFKLRQLGSVSNYQAQFEKLGNRVIGLPVEALLNYFIVCLSPDIRNEMAIQRPTTIIQAIGLVKLIETKLKDSKSQSCFSKPYTPSSSSHYTRPQSTTNTTTNTNTSQSLPDTSQTPLTESSKIPTPTPTKLPIKRLNQSQLQERRALGLCYNCDEKFIPGHKCSTSHFILLLIDEEEDTKEPNLEETEPVEDTITQETNDTYFQLSPQAVTGHFSPRTLKFQASIHGLPVMVLIDTESTHNILQPRIASHLHLTLSPIPLFSVMVGNKSYLKCEGIFHNVLITLQIKDFPLPFYLIPIEGADVVLGMAWLETLGPINADFKISSMTFQHNNEPITLKGNPKPLPTQSTFHRVCHLVHTNVVASLHLLSFEPIPSTPKSPHRPTQSNNPKIELLLSQFPTVFNTPYGLPSSRTHDRHMPLLPNTSPVNVKPYRYPHSQKDSMTIIIQDMLKEGTIIPSTSPFSSPVLLVRKKDDTWRFCVDYRALNAVTVKDCFPIPTIDELLDELGAATVFTKIDLHSGYHQIRVAPEDTHKTAFRTFDGHYKFLVMPFGLSNAPSTFQSVMNDLLRPYLRHFVLIFL